MSGSISGSNIIGSGSDTIGLTLSEDQAQGGDAQFTVNVDGQQIGGPLSVSAAHSAGQEQSFTFAGNYDPGPHNVTVTFVNNFLYPGSPGDRNLYVDGVSYDGQTISSTTTPIYEGPFFPPNSGSEGVVRGDAVYSVNDTTPVPTGAPSEPSTTPGPVSTGSGPDTLVLNMSEDPYMGDAQFTVAVDGQQVGGPLTTTAITNEGQQQEFDIHGNFGGGSHTVTVTFINDKIGDLYPGTGDAVDTTDRNLYIMSTSLNGGPASPDAPWEQGENGSHNLTVTSGSNPAATGDSSVTSDFAPVTPSSLSSTPITPDPTTAMAFIAAPTVSATTDMTASPPASDTSSMDPMMTTSMEPTMTTPMDPMMTTSMDPTMTTSMDPTMTTDMAGSIGAAIAGATPTAADYSIPSMMDPSGTGTTSLSMGAMSSMYDPTAHMGMSAMLPQS